MFFIHVILMSHRNIPVSTEIYVFFCIYCYIKDIIIGVNFFTSLLPFIYKELRHITMKVIPYDV